MVPCAEHKWQMAATQRCKIRFVDISSKKKNKIKSSSDAPIFLLPGFTASVFLHKNPFTVDVHLPCTWFLYVVFCSMSAASCGDFRETENMKDSLV